jgi:hypothetical protein
MNLISVILLSLWTMSWMITSMRAGLKVRAAATAAAVGSK